MKAILMSKENPTGYKLEELLIQLQNEIIAKNKKIIGDGSDLSKHVQNNNLQIMKHLNQARNYQVDSFNKMAEKAPDEGANGTPRIGNNSTPISYRPVVLESPFAGDINRNRAYLEACMRDCIINHEDAPIASHKLYTDALDDNKADERTIGIGCGLVWGQFADACVVYVDHGMTEGMQIGIQHYRAMGIPIIERRLY